MARPILVVEDDKKISRVVKVYLEGEGHRVTIAENGKNALEAAQKETPALVILDLMLPDISGEEVCQELRELGDFPIIMVTAKSSENERVAGFALGADDYVVKPFSPRELVARVKAVLRRSKGKPQSEKLLKIGDLEIDMERYVVSIRTKPVKLSATEFKLLLFLAERRGKVFSRDQLLDAIWRDEAFVEPRTVDVHIRRLRSGIEEDPAQPRYIKTMRGIGYFFDAK